MTAARLKKAQRLLKVQRDLQEIEERKVAGLRHRQAELADLREEMLRALSSDEGLQGLFVGAIVRRLKSLGEEATLIGDELERRSRALQAYASRTKFAERRAQTCEQEHAHEVARKELMEIIERFIRPENASLP